MTRLIPLMIAAVLGSAPPAGAAADSGDAPPPVQFNDHRTAAGTLREGVLTLRLDAVTAVWRPEQGGGPLRTVHAFAEEGRAPSIPGPLLRVREGTDVRVTVRNRLMGSPLRVYGLAARPADPEAFTEIASGATREFRFPAGTPGTYFYWATSTGAPLNQRTGVDGQLSGAFIVDPKHLRDESRDRIFVISEWLGEPNPPALRKFSAAINGASWPHTERLTLPFGEAVTWRVINASFGGHPMHLHGTFYTVESRGTFARDTIYGPDGRRMVTTEFLEAGATMTMRWVPDRVGNWLFHCHILAHVSGDMRLADLPPEARKHALGHGEHDIERVMAGLVLGIKVLPGDETAALDLERATARGVRLHLQSMPNRYRSEPGFGFSIADDEREPLPLDRAATPSPTLVLERGKPVVITLMNHLDEETSIHWHGMELESFNDGVPGWSGDGHRLLPAVAPGSSLEVRFTPPRAGTFIYHTHGHDRRQLASGLYAALIVVEPGHEFDPQVERVVLLGGAGPGSPAIEVNRSTNPPPMVMRVGVKYRFRLINITPNFNAVVWLRGEGAPVQWRAIAKDGSDLPPSQATARVARQLVAVGETYDFEYEPSAPGDLRLEAYRPAAGPLTQPTVTSMIVRVTR
jgi:FtsP/CotA-like multicopper oxidase with cupredoxin domain